MFKTLDKELIGWENSPVRINQIEHYFRTGLHLIQLYFNETEEYGLAYWDSDSNEFQSPPLTYSERGTNEFEVSMFYHFEHDYK